MLKKLNFLCAILFLSGSLGFAQVGTGSIKGTVTDKNTGEALPFVKVVALNGGQQQGFASTDFDGKFLVSSLAPGEYTIEVRFVGYNTVQLEGVVVNSDKLTQLDVELSTSEEMLDVVEVVEYTVPLIDKDGGASGATVTRDDISKMPTRSATGIAATVGGVYNQEGSDGLSVRGARSDATYYYIDGIKVRGSSSLPKSAIQEVAVITGGVPANYGDVTGGIVSITTRGPSAKYFGSFEGVTSGFYFNGKDPLGYDGKVFGLDKYAYNLFEGMISGPLLMQKDSSGKPTSKPILGFFLSANYTDVLDARPLANGGAYRIKKEVRDSLLDPSKLGPLRPSGQGTGAYYNTEFLRHSDDESLSAFEQVPWRMNARSRAFSAAGKLDVNAGPNINLTFGGNMAYSQGANYSYSNSLYNFENFGESRSYDWRVYGRFTQRFNNNEEGSTSKIKSAYYSLMIDYSQNHGRTWDATHEDRIFNYGYVGKFETFRETTYEFNQAGDSLIHNGFRDTLVRFTPSTTNEAFAAITSQYYDIYAGDPVGHYENLFQIQQGNGLRNGDVPQNVYGIWENMGTPFNSYGYSQADQFRVTGSGTVNLNDHAISLGFEYEQRWDRSFGGAPIGLWTIARQYMNNHILELDRSNVAFDYYGTYPRVTYSRLNASEGAYTGQEFGDAQYFFDYNVRKKLGLDTDGTDFVDIDNIDPDFFTLDMFNADELLNSGNSYFTWFGYDHTGEKVRGNTDINKYFTEFDENGNYKRHIGAFQPIYMSGYIMDKFAFDDIIFNVGVRVDVYDANQPVLKDPYLLYEAKTVREATAFENGTEIVHPDNIGDDYVVYVNDVSNPTAINGYRNGDTWYDASGVEISDPTLLEGANGIAPWLQNDTLTSPTADSFKDYDAQINFMPRVAFSFPISDEASFFAHYDILTKRPTTGNRFNPTDYQFLQARSVIINNPDLKPERTIDYELGFQQVLSKTSSIKISAFYKEQRDQVQLINVFSAYPVQYRTYGNRDFGTVKGLTVSYDLRRTGNVRMTAAYTLQFANGTGSDPNSALTLINSGEANLRTIFPYTYDQRHGFNIVFDYRYGGGKDYNGPVINDFAVLENTGMNIVTQIGSGTPYSAYNRAAGEALLSAGSAQLDGSLNGSRKPWQYRVDFQIDRNFDLEFGSDEDKKKAAYLNVYLRVTNLFNIINVLNVYRATGNPDDDGYLAASQFQSSIQNQLDEQAYRELYMLKVQNPYNYGIPRTIRLGVKFDF
ncbi:TonB-dependent receptor [Crocinitomix algicola]|uniref:TonB-dependent receptor n=1 Tax=Crocinitomix algicola TaxID=1740263 RepID=UPI0008727596|nr:carboxypeptidase regulatory-like domain-containing protein [Crocinitomix algicola]